MGGGIGMSCAEAGLEVVLLDINEEGTVPKRVTNTTVFFCRLLSYI
jgi:3-hydroxyacyl-CoA dehydrogenase